MNPTSKSDPAISAPSEECKICAWRKPAIIAVGVIGLVAAFLLFDVRALLREALSVIERLGSWGPALFVLIYTLATVLLVPGSVLTLGAGLIFGVVRGSLLVSLASTLGATCAFLIGRYLARDWVAKKIEKHRIFAAIENAVAEQGWKIVALTRLSPVFPFVLLNYAFGLTRVKTRDYVLASWLGMLPGTIMYVYLGSLGRAGLGGQERSPAQWALYGVGLLATIAVTVMITRTARRALARRTKTHSNRE